MTRLDIDMPLGCIYEKNGKTEYCPLCNHYDVPFCQVLDDDKAEIGIDERPCYCPLSAEPQERTGKWIDQHHNEEWWGRLYKCNLCGAEMIGDADFCPDCGARMEVENENNH